MCPSIWTSKPFLDLSIVDIENEISLYFENIELNYKKNIEKKIDPKKKIKALKDELERITNVYTKGRTTEKNYDLEYERIEKEIKDLGRKVSNFDSEIWDENKEKIVFEGNLAKFTQNDRLKSLLMNTGDSILVEASPYDRIWGIGLKSDDVSVNNPNNWLGQNLFWW